MNQYPSMSAHLINGGPATHTAQDRALVKLSDDSDMLSEPRILFFEPITAAVVCMWLAQGAVAYVGGLAMGKILGHPSLSDIESLIRQAVEEIKTFLRDELKRQIEENELRKMQAQLDSAIRNLKQYDLYPESEKRNARFLVEDALIKSGEVMSLSSRFEMNGAFIFANAVSVRAIAHIAMKKAGLISVDDPLIETLSEGCETLKRILVPHRQSWAPETRLSPPQLVVYPEGGPGGQPLIFVTFEKDKRRIDNIVWNPGKATPDELKERFWRPIRIGVEADYVSVMDKTEVPLMAISSEWQKLIV